MPTAVTEMLTAAHPARPAEEALDPSRVLDS